MNEDFFNRQKEFQDLLGNDITTQEFKNMMFLGLFEEVSELLRETPHKKHKKNQTFNRDGFIEECVDVQIYLVNLLLSANVTYEEFTAILKQKQDKNFKRQEEGY